MDRKGAESLRENPMLGIDVSKATLACALVDPATKRVRWRRETPNSASGITQLLSQTPVDSAWVLEPTGRYSHLAAQLGQRAGRRVLLAPPRKAKSFMASIQTRAATDASASVGLALFALSQELPRYPIKCEKIEAVDQLLSARRGIGQAITALELRLRELPHAAPYLKESIAALEAQRKAIDQQIAKASEEAEISSDVSRLREVPGIGPVTAAAAASRLCSRGFTHSDQFVAFIGLDLEIADSGTKKGRRTLTKQGDAELRRLFFTCARAAVQSKTGPFREQFERERAKGLPSTGCYCAVARKLARLCWSLVRHQSHYDPDRVYTQPQKRQEEEAS